MGFIKYIYHLVIFSESFSRESNIMDKGLMFKLEWFK